MILWEMNNLHFWFRLSNVILLICPLKAAEIVTTGLSFWYGNEIILLFKFLYNNLSVFLTTTTTKIRNPGLHTLSNLILYLHMRNSEGFLNVLPLPLDLACLSFLLPFFALLPSFSFENSFSALYWWKY